MQTPSGIWCAGIVAALFAGIKTQLAQYVPGSLFFQRLQYQARQRFSHLLVGYVIPFRAGIEKGGNIAAVNNGSVALSVREKINYGFGDAGCTIVTGLISNFLTFFYTDIFGLTPAIVGTLFLVLRVIDAISDPVIGIIADRNSPVKGQFRPFLLWTAVPLDSVVTRIKIIDNRAF